MPDREKVIKGLEAYATGSGCMKNCPYWRIETLNCSRELATDAIVLLKALDVTPEELERLKKCRHECKIDCLLEHYEKIKAERDALLKAQEPEASDMPKPDSEIGCWYDITHNYTLEQVVSALKAQEPYKKGYWIYPLSTDCICSECGNQPEHEPGESVPLYDYCPYCGAEMEVKWE